jgi:hypothetical protein
MREKGKDEATRGREGQPPNEAVTGEEDGGVDREEEPLAEQVAAPPAGCGSRAVSAQRSASTSSHGRYYAATTLVLELVLVRGKRSCGKGRRGTKADGKDISGIHAPMMPATINLNAVIDTSMIMP